MIACWRSSIATRRSGARAARRYSAALSRPTCALAAGAKSPPHTAAATRTIPALAPSGRVGRTKVYGPRSKSRRDLAAPVQAAGQAASRSGVVAPGRHLAAQHRHGGADHAHHPRRTGRGHRRRAGRLEAAFGRESRPCTDGRTGAPRRLRGIGPCRRRCEPCAARSPSRRAVRTEVSSEPRRSSFVVRRSCDVEPRTSNHERLVLVTANVRARRSARRPRPCRRGSRTSGRIRSRPDRSAGR